MISVTAQIARNLLVSVTHHQYMHYLSEENSWCEFLLSAALLSVVVLIICSLPVQQQHRNLLRTTNC